MSKKVKVVHGARWHAAQGHVLMYLGNNLYSCSCGERVEKFDREVSE